MLSENIGDFRASSILAIFIKYEVKFTKTYKHNIKVKNCVHQIILVIYKNGLNLILEASKNKDITSRIRQYNKEYI